MSHVNNSPEPTLQPRLRALVELADGELRIFPICDNDVDEQRILDALRFVREDVEQ
jgi:hypothetical protein